MKKKAIGFYTALLTAILAVVGLIFYFVNCGTAYFSNLGSDPMVIAALIIAVVLQLVAAFLSGVANHLLADIAAVVSPALLAIALVRFVSARINGIAAIMTFEGNAQTMADLTSAIVAIALFVVAMLIAVISAFFDAQKN